MTRRNQIFLILIVALGLSAYSLFTKYKPSNQNPRYAAYMAGKKNPIGQSEKEQIEEFRSKLCRNIQAMARDTGPEHRLSSDLKHHSPKGFQPRACTFAFLQTICLNGATTSNSSLAQAPKIDRLTQDVNVYFGNGSFPSDFRRNKLNGGMPSEIEGFLQDRYLLVLKPTAVVKPEFYVGTSQFTSGSFDGFLFVLDLAQDSVLGKLDFHVENSDKLRSGPMIKSGMDKKLVEDLKDNILVRVNDYSSSLFGRPLEDYGKKVFGLLDEFPQK